jgi:hypothetical protein
VSDNPFAGGPPLDPAVLAMTRRGLHQVAEQLLAADLYQHTGRIGLRPTPGGLGTPTYIVGGVSRQVRVEGTELVVVHGDERTRLPLATVADAASFLGIAPGAPPVYEGVTPLEPDRALDLDDRAVRAIAAWFALGAQALERFAAAHGGAEPTRPQLWPEHFDLALSLGEANYGVSPGDDDHLLPYAYIGPWSPPPVGSADGFWNEPFGHGDPADRFDDATDLVALFEDGFRLL